MKEVFDCAVYSRYSNEENGILAAQYNMESDKFRVNISCVWVEILRINEDSPALPGEIGRVVVTDLTNDAMPIIRYDTGDLSSYNEGDKVKDLVVRINNIDGRKVDLLVDTNEEPLNPHHVTNAFWGTGDFISTFQLIQFAPDKVTLKYTLVPNRTFNEPLIDQKLKKIFGDSLQVSYELVDDIPLLRSGKRRYIVNMMNNPSPVK